MALSRKIFCLLLGGSFALRVQGARVAAEASNDASCEGLKTLFDDHYARLQSGEHTGVLVQSISLLRNLQRANAKECDWIEGEDVSAATELAGRYLHGNPCYEQVFAAMRYADSHPEDEREHAMEDAMSILSSHGGCAHIGSSLVQGVVFIDASCEELKTIFDDHYARLQSGEHTGVLVHSISLLRNLQRANAKECDWIEDEDVSAATELAGRYLHGNPCYEQAFAAMRYADSHPPEEREHVLQEAMAILNSHGGCDH